jgi:hypothetical protein
MPAAPPPPGHIPDFNSPDNYKQRNIILHTVVLSFTTVAVFIRVYTRAIIKKNFSVDDCESSLLRVSDLESRRSVLTLIQGSRCYHGYDLENFKRSHHVFN